MKKQIILTGQNMQAMKNLLLLLSIFFLAGCRGDDSEHPIHGQWSLLSHDAGFSPQLERFNMGEIIWTFNPDNRLSVQIQSGIECRCGGLVAKTSGRYKYSIRGDSLKLINNEYEYDIIDNNTLYISYHPEADGPLVSFKKTNE